MLRSCVLAFAGLALMLGGGAQAEPRTGASASGAAAAGAAAAANPAVAGIAVAFADEEVPDDPALDDLDAPVAKSPSAETAPEAAAPPPEPTLVASINLTEQRMVVSERGETRFSWPISSGVARYATPTGTFKPQWTSKMWYSRKYDWAPMPHAVFINGGVAVHGTHHVSSLGSPASHGCIRLSPTNAKTFYNLVQRHGLKNVKVTVYGRPHWRSEPNVASRDTNRRRNVASGDYDAWFWGGSGGTGKRADGDRPAKRKHYADGGRYYYTDGTPARTYRNKDGKLVFAPREKRRRAYGYGGYGYDGYGYGGW